MESSSTFKYQEVVQKALAYIESHGLRPGDRLPSERQFADELKIGRPTVNKALACLIAEGRLHREGYKLYVATPSKSDVPDISIAVLSPHPLRQRKVVTHNLVEAAHDVCTRAKVKFIPYLSNDAIQQREQLLEIQRNSDAIQGIVIWPHPEAKCESLLRQIASRGISIVANDIDLGDFDFVGVDNHAGIQLLVKHLFELGHRNVAYLTRELTHANLIDRKESYEFEAFKLLGDRSREACFELREGDDIEATMKRIQSKFPQCTAIICSHDYLALELIQYCNKNAIDVPADISICGFDGIDWGASSSPSLTTVAQNFYQMGVIATEILIRRIQKFSHETHAQKVRVSPTLIRRESVCAVEGGKRVSKNRR